MLGSPFISVVRCSKLHFRELSFEEQLEELNVHLDVPYVPSEERVVKAILELGGVDADDVLYDLGSGDGRIVVAAAHLRGAQAVGVEIDQARVREAEEYAAQMGVEHMVSFIEYDLFHADFSPATVVTMYLLHSVNVDLRPRLLDELRPGTRVVSHAFDMGDWKPDRRVSSGGVSLFLLIIPAKVAGTWDWLADERHYRVTLRQTYQRVSGEAWVDGRPATLEKAVLWGDWLELVIRPAGQDEAETLFMRCGRNRWAGHGGVHQGVIASRLDA